MTQEELTLLQIKGMISDMSPEDQAKARECVDEIITSINKYGPVGYVAAAFVGAQMAIQTNVQ